jgi:Flp pilus assembly protein TadD
VLAENDAPFHRFNLAVVFEREGNLDRAIEEYRAAASTGIADPRIYLNLGNSLARTGRGEEAREAYRTVMRISPEYSPLVQSNLGVLAAQSGDWQEAVRRFNECVVLDPTHVGGHLGLGLAYFELGRFDDAIVAFRRTLDLPGAPVVQVHRNLAAAYLEAGLPEEALREARAALQLDPEDVASVLTMGRAYLVEGRSEEASRMFRRAEQMAPGVPAVRKAIDEVEGVEDEDS